MRPKFFSALKRPPKELNHVRSTLRARSWITSGTAKPNQESNMTSNAVADGTKPREVNEEPLLKDRGKGIVEVGSLCESPQFRSDLGSLGCEAEEIWKNPESPLYAILKLGCCISPRLIAFEGALFLGTATIVVFAILKFATFGHALTRLSMIICWRRKWQRLVRI